MKEIAYAGRTVCTSDEIGSLVVQISALLAKRNIAEAITVPIRLDGAGENPVAEMVVGLGNDVLATPCDEEADVSLDAGELADTLRKRLAELQGRRPSPTPTVEHFNELDWI